VNLQDARIEVIKAFDPMSGCYYHKTDYRHHNFIDGMAWCGLLTGAARRKGDKALTELGSFYLGKLLAVGKDARNYALHQVDEEWIASTSMPGYWYLQKPQSFAGPAGLHYAGLGPRPAVAPVFRCIAWVYGLTYPLFESHLNSIMLAFLIDGKKPPATLEKICLSNPFYAAIYGERVYQEYPPMYRYTEGFSETHNTIVPLANCEPSSWVFRRNPYKEYQCKGVVEQHGYTPIWQVVGEYLQEML
jgi:hypothetical protein